MAWGPTASVVFQKLASLLSAKLLSVRCLALLLYAQQYVVFTVQDQPALFYSIRPNLDLALSEGQVSYRTVFFSKPYIKP